MGIYPTGAPCCAGTRRPVPGLPEARCVAARAENCSSQPPEIDQAADAIKHGSAGGRAEALAEPVQDHSQDHHRGPLEAETDVQLLDAA